MTSATPVREIVVADTVAWLSEDAARRDCSQWSIVSSIPDASETGQEDAAWRRFFVDMARGLMALVPDDGVMVLFQTDLRRDGAWLDKARLCSDGAADAGGIVVAKKIVCRRPTGTTSSRRAAYTNLLCFARRPLDTRLPDTVPDVIADAGPVTWTRGVGLFAARAAMTFVRRYAPMTTTVVDPFCGEGMLVAVANEAGFAAIGVERHGKRAELARRLRIEDIRGAGGAADDANDDGVSEAEASSLRDAGRDAKAVGNDRQRRRHGET